MVTSDRTPFWQALERFGDAPALINEASKTRISYDELEAHVRRGCDRLSDSRKKLVWLAASNDFGGICNYLSALRAGHAICLWPASSAHIFDEELIEKYKPDIILWKDPQHTRRAPEEFAPEPDIFGYRYTSLSAAPSLQNHDLALLMPTSGSTGSPKIARLSRQNIECSANQVVEALQIKADQRAITTLPMSFIYGLTVINSHLKAGASIVLTERSVYDRRFWLAAQTEAVTNLPAIPWTVQALKETNFEREQFPRLQRIAISGGALGQQLIEWLTVSLHNRGVEIYSMYGQTEACGRITVLPPSRFGINSYSVGVTVPGGKIECNNDGQIIYTGPNVMLGYAEDRSELDKGDELHGVLHTGDMGVLDCDGFLRITGRISRVSKLWGRRVNLDDLERRLGAASTAAIEMDGRLHIFVQDRGLSTNQLKETLAEQLQVSRHMFELNVVDTLPRTPSGKIEYGKLKHKAQ